MHHTNCTLFCYFDSDCDEQKENLEREVILLALLALIFYTPVMCQLVLIVIGYHILKNDDIFRHSLF